MPTTTAYHSMEYVKRHHAVQMGTVNDFRRLRESEDCKTELSSHKPSAIIQ